jgi:hypothetical protein
MKLRIIQDSCPESPREWCNLGTIAYKHRNYTLGEEKIGDPIEWLEGMLGLEPKYEYTNERLSELEDKFSDEYIALTLYLYDHSGISISTSSFSCRWDSGKVGYIYVDKDTVRKEYGWKNITKKRAERIRKYLEGEIEYYDQYLRGDVYGFILEDDEGEEIDSCWGFYGDDWKENGMADHIEEKFHAQLEVGEVEY